MFFRPHKNYSAKNFLPFGGFPSPASSQERSHGNNKYKYLRNSLRHTKQYTFTNYAKNPQPSSSHNCQHPFTKNNISKLRANEATAWTQLIKRMGEPSNTCKCFVNHKIKQTWVITSNFITFSSPKNLLFPRKPITLTYFLFLLSTSWLRYCFLLLFHYKQYRNTAKINCALC